MKYTIFALVFVLSGCTSSVDVPGDKYGVLLHLGEIQKSAAGPASLEKVAFIESVLLIDKLFEIRPGKGRYVVSYEVTDPESYYKLVGGSRTISGILDRELARLSLQGRAIHTEDDLYEVINEMNLPVIIKRIDERKK